MRSNIFGFGYDPADCNLHFVVSIPRKGDAPVSIYERCSYSEFDKDEVIEKNVLKCVLDREKWDIVQPTLTEYLNKILKSQNRRMGRFITGETPVERLLAAEMMVLIWSIEDCDKEMIPVAVQNWTPLWREEKWWLYTMTNAATGDWDHKRGWRIALRYIFTDNPTSKKVGVRYDKQH